MAKIKVVIVDKDTIYLNRFTEYMYRHYGDKLEIRAFSKLEAFENFVEQGNEKIEVVLYADTLDIERRKLPEKSVVLIMTEHAESTSEQVAKYQKAELIYKDILNAYAEIWGTPGRKNITDGTTVVYLCSSVGSGSGISTIAAAMAIAMAQKGKKTLYLDLERFSTVDEFFSGDGKYTMSDVLFALLSNKADISTKLESMVRQDKSGVYFFAGYKNALEQLDFDEEVQMQLLKTLVTNGGYDAIFIDTEFKFHSMTYQLMDEAQYIVVATDGKRTTNHKLQQYVGSIALLEEQHNEKYLEKSVLFFNKYSSKFYDSIEFPEIKNAGMLPKYENGSIEQILDHMSKQQSILTFLEGGDV